MIVTSNKNLSIYTNKSWFCEHRTEKVVVHYMNIKVGDLQQMVYQETAYGKFWMTDDEERHLSILSL